MLVSPLFFPLGIFFFSFFLQEQKPFSSKCPMRERNECKKKLISRVRLKIFSEESNFCARTCQHGHSRKGHVGNPAGSAL